MEKIADQLKSIYNIYLPSKTAEAPSVKGYDFNNGVDYSRIFASYASTGIQATSLANAISVINKMINFKDSCSCENKNECTFCVDGPNKCTIFLGYTSNMVSSGMRDIIRFLVEHKYVDVLVTTAGGIEEDFIKCMKPFYVSDFNSDDNMLRSQGLNRIGNMLVPNENYCAFEDWLLPIFSEMYENQEKNKTIYTPSSIIKKLGEKINNPESIYYWAYKNDIPVFCPALTDGAIGDMLFYNNYKRPNFIVDIVQDVVALNKIALKARKSGVVILGGGVVKHHIMNANIWRNGADWGVLVNTGVHYDASDSGASPSEAISWGKMKGVGEMVKVFCESSLVFPIIVGETWGKKWEEEKKEKLQKN